MHLADALAGWGSVALLAALAFSLRNGGPRDAEVAHAPIGGLLLIGALAAVLCIRPWLGHGIPGFAHDWKWPVTAPQLAAWPRTLGSLWLPWGSGSPNVQALAGYPLVLFAWLLGHAFSPATTLDITLIAILAVAGIACARLAAAMHLSPGWQYLAAAVYPLMPSVFNRLASGHVNWLLAYALVPAGASIALLWPASWRRAAAIGLLWGIAACQIQFLLFFGIALLVAGQRILRWDLAVAAVLTGALQAPMLAALLVGHPLVAFASAHANAAWQLQQSGAPVLALAGAADPSRYFDAIEPRATWLLAPFLAATIAGVATGSTVRPVAAVWLLASIWSMGLRGPLALPLGMLFRHVLPATMFREFSHAQALVAPLGLCLAMLGSARVARLSPRGAALGLCALILLPVVLPAAGGAVAVLDPALRVPREWSGAANRLANAPGSGQILWLPEPQPLTFAGTRGGVDPLAQRDGQHDPFVEYIQTPELVWALRALATSNPSACGLLGNLGVQYVVARASVKSIADPSDVSIARAPSREQLRVAGLVELANEEGISIWSVPCYRGMLTWAPASELYGSWSDVDRIARSGATDEVTLPPESPRTTVAEPPPAPGYLDTDPANGWVTIADRPDLLARFGSAFGDVVVTSRADASFPGAYALMSDGRSPYAWKTTAVARQAVARGTIAVWQIAKTGVAPSAISYPLAASPPQISHPLADAFSVALFARAPQPGSIVVLHQRSTGGWTAVVGTRELVAVPADGFAQGWLVDGTGTMTVHYDAPPIAFLWAIVGAALVLALIVLKIPFGRSSS